MGLLRDQNALEKLAAELGISQPRGVEDFKIFFMSAYDRYDELTPSYVKRNISFLADSLFITLKHATKPVSNPSGFGLSLGSLIGMLEKAENADVSKAIFSNPQTLKFLTDCITILKGIKGFNMDYIYEVIKSADTSNLDPDELQKFTGLAQL